MIDIHIHLLPAVDDGAESEEVTRAMLEQARTLGFRVLVATPHLPGPLDPQYAARVNAAYARTWETGRDLGVEVLQGFEAALSPDLPRRLARAEPIGLAGGDAVLADLPFGSWLPQAEDTLFAIQVAGFRPVLAHPERYQAVQRDGDLARRLVERGIVLQVTLGSLVGLFGRAAQRAAERLLRDGLVHVAASDAHSAGHRYEAVPAGLARLRALVGDEGVTQLLDAAPRALLDGQALPEPPVARSGGWFTGLLPGRRRRAS